MDLTAALAGLDQLWSPRLAARVNDYGIRFAKVAGEHVWHKHEVPTGSSSSSSSTASCRAVCATRAMAPARSSCSAGQALGRYLAAVFDTPPENAASQHFGQMRRDRDRQRYDARPTTKASAAAAAFAALEQTRPAFRACEVGACRRA